MTTGKIDRNAVVTSLKGSTAPEKINTVAKADEVLKPVEAENQFGERSPLLDPKVGSQGKAVSTSASLKQLWGQEAIAGANPPLAARRMGNCSHAERPKKIAETQQKMAECEKKVEGRVEELDKKWKYMSLQRKTESLKEYLAATPNLTPENRAEIENAIKISDDAQVKLNALREEVRQLRPDKNTGKNGTPEERKALAHKLVVARRAQSEAVTAATAAVDAVGLKIERLMLTEDKIDPTGGQNSMFGSLKALIGQYFELSFSLQVLFSMNTEFMREMEQDRIEAQKRKVIDDAWRQRDDMMRQMLTDLQLRIESKGVEVKQNNVSRGTKRKPGAPPVADGPKPVATPALKAATKL